MTNQRILVVDDEVQMLAAIKESLRRCEYDVVTASSPIEALNRFAENHFSLVITDMKMPMMSGIEFLRNVKKEKPSMPVIMVTAYGTIDTAIQAMREGAFDYIIKPFSTEKLENVVKKALSSLGRKELSPKKLNGGVYSEEKEMITQDKKMEEIIKIAEKVSKSKSTVLIQGESGTGKELLAYHIHKSGQRRDRPFIAINCAALPGGLLESELFGHEKGSFTGAITKKIGKFELANQGTILLDEISEMELQLQAKLLRVLQDHRVDRVGGREPIPIDIRVIATTNRDLSEEIKKEKFREDLFYRLNVIPLVMPPLREREGDIELLANYFLVKYNRKNQGNVSRIAEETIELLKKYTWKGNVRELENVIERAVVLCHEKVILPKHLFINEEYAKEESTDSKKVALKAGISLKEMEKQLIFKTLDEVKGNKTHAAKILGVSIRTLRNKLSEYKENSILAA